MALMTVAVAAKPEAGFFAHVEQAGVPAGEIAYVELPGGLE